MIEVDPLQALGFRLEGHNLARRLPPGSALEAAGACGLQNTPPGSAALSVHARVEALDPAEVDKRLFGDRSLGQVWSQRASPHLVPTAEAAVFTTGLLPDDEASRRFYIFGAGDHLDGFGWSATMVVERTAAALPGVLADRELTKDELGAELAASLLPFVSLEQRELWKQPDELTTYGETLVRFALSIVALQGLFVIAPRQRKVTTFMLTEDWLGGPLPRMDPAAARAELAQRYLACYGPSNPDHLARWAGISPEQAQKTWDLIAGELAEMRYAGKPAWVNQKDLSRLESPAAPSGVRLLPPHDPYLQMRDRQTLLPDRGQQRLLWRAAGGPGTVLADGRLAVIWRPDKKGKRLRLVVTALGSLSAQERDEIQAEAGTLAPFRGCETVQAVFEAS